MIYTYHISKGYTCLCTRYEQLTSSPEVELPGSDDDPMGPIVDEFGVGIKWNATLWSDKAINIIKSPHIVEIPWWDMIDSRYLIDI